MAHHSVNSLSTLTSSFDPRPVHVSVVVVIMALEEVVLRVIGFVVLRVVLAEYISHLHVHVALTRKSNGQSLGTFPKMFFSK